MPEKPLPNTVAKKLPKKKYPSKRVASTSKPQKILGSVSQNRSRIILLLIIAIVIALLYLFKSLFVAAIVNGQPISRISVVRELEKQAGKNALDSLITRTLVSQEAKKRNISISQKEIDQEVKKLEEKFAAQGQKLDDLLLIQGLTKRDLIEQIGIQKMVEKMLARDITITDKEVAEYIEKNKSSLPEGIKPENVKEQLRQQKLSEEFQSLLKTLREKAKIIYFVNY